MSACLPKVKKGCDKVVEDFDRRYTVEEEIKREGDVEAVEKLMEAAYEALRTIDGPLRDHIKRFVDYEKGIDV